MKKMKVYGELFNNTVGGVESAYGGLPEQRAVGRSVVPGKWDAVSGYFSWQRKVLGPERSPGCNLC